MDTSLPFVGHRQIWQTLIELHRNQRLPHALLLTGPEGIGKQRLARCLAQTLLTNSQNFPNGHNLEIQHPDFYSLESEGKVIKIDTIREVRKVMAFAPLGGKHRVVFLNDAHQLNTAAANALLKTLEEPPPETFFLLISHAPGWLPRTVLSRCQTLRFSPLTLVELQKVFSLLETPTPSPEILQKCQGSVALALRFQALQDLLPKSQALQPGPGALGFAQAWQLAQETDTRNLSEDFLHGLLALLHQILLQESPTSDARFRLLDLVDQILEMQRGLRQNLNPKIHLTRLLLYLQEPWKHPL